MSPIQKGWVMTLNSLSPRLLSLSFIVSLLGLVCKAAIPTPLTSPAITPDQNLKAIVDLNEILDESSPTQFAAYSLSDYFQTKNDMDQGLLRERHHFNESKTSIFQKSFLNYIKNRYNKRNYAQELSQDGSDIIQFFNLINEVNLGPDVIYVGTRLFYNKLKAAELIDDTVLLQTLEAVPAALERHFISANHENFAYDLALIKRNIESIIITKFTQHHSDFQTQPDTFLSQLSNDLALYYQQEAETLNKQTQKRDILERLRSMVIRFYDTILNKVIWDPRKPEVIWRSFNSIAAGLQGLAQYSVINHMDDLDDLLWTLNYRFCYFLDLAGATLPTSFYQEVEQALEGKAVSFLEFKEQDEGITAKKEILSEYLLQAKARAFAYEKKGIISTPLL
jgi:hypothetical protein